MEATVYRSAGEFWVDFDGEDAGPFDDLHDAVCAARRHSDTVRESSFNHEAWKYAVSLERP